MICSYIYIMYMYVNKHIELTQQGTALYKIYVLLFYYYYVLYIICGTFFL